MRKLLLAALAALAIPSVSFTQEEPEMPAPLMFFDIAGPASAGLGAFYGEVFGWKPGADGNLRVDVQPPLFGAFRVEDVAESLIYIGVSDVTASLEEITNAGGSIDFPRLVVPGVVILGMFRDPAGNRVGLVEIDAEGRAVVPPAPGNQ